MSYLSECEAFKILGLPSDSNFNVVKKRFNELALIHHPDKNQNQGACEKFSKIYKAYNVLKNLHYDGNTTKENFQSPPNIFDLMLTLEEIFNGVVKYKEIKRKLIDKYESIVLEVEVIPGTLTGTNIVLPNKGDILSENGVAANVIFIVKEFKHDKFTRERFNLIHKLEINVMNAFRIDQPLIIPTIDGDTIEIEMDQIIVSTTEKKIPNRGLPYPKDPNGKRGSMIVRFDIKYDQSKIKLLSNRYELELSLKELFTGCKQTLPVVRTKLDGTSETIQKEVIVEAGTLNGTIIYFENEGDQEEGSLPADLEFVIIQIEDPIYKVRDFDLEISSSIDEQQAKNGCELNVPTIEGTEISVYFEPGVTTGTTKRIPNYGLLKPDKTRGDLVIRVDTIENENVDMEIDTMDSFDSIKSNEQFNHSYYDDINTNGKDIRILPKMSFKPSIREEIAVNLDINEDSVSSIENEKGSIDKVPNSTIPPIIINLPVSIENVMTGISIEKKFVQEIMDENGQIINKNSKLYTIEIQPGCLANTKLFYKNEGHRYGNEPSDLIFMVVDVPHPQFVRNASNLVYTAKVHEKMIEVQIPVFDKGQRSFITIPVKKPGEYEFIENLGLPNPAEHGKRGLLIVKFVFDPNYQSVKCFRS